MQADDVFSKMDAEREELRVLLDRGVSLEVEQTVRARRPGILGFLRRKVLKVRSRKFVVKEPTLAVLDLIAAEQLMLDIEESAMQGEQGLVEARKISKAHMRRMAKILALAALGSDYIIATQRGPRVSYRYDDRRLNEFTDAFFYGLRPSKLLRYCLLIISMSNLADFMSSIRLMSASRTTMPVRIEEGKKA